MARPPITDEELDRPLRAAPQRSTARRVGRRARGRPCRRHALLLLRAAVRHQVEGARQQGGRLRAVVRVPLQRGQAVPEGREALPPGQPSGPAAAPDGTRRVRARRVPRDQLGPGARPGRRRDPPDPGRARRRRVRHVVGRVAHEREELPRSASSPGSRCTPPTSTTTAGTAWCRPAPATRRRSGSTGRRTRGATSRSPTWCGWRARTSPRRSRSPRATSGGRGPWRQA